MSSLKNCRIVPALLGLSCAAVLIAAAPEPTTAPATRPVAPPASRPSVPAFTPANSIEVKSEKFGLVFRVPKLWQKRDTDATQGGEMFMYGPPPPTQVPLGSPPVDRHVAVLLGNSVDAGTTLDDLAGVLRGKVAEALGHPVKFTHDASAGTVAGEPAWRLEYPSEQTVHVTSRVNGVDKGAHDVKVTTSERMVFWIHNRNVAQLQYSCDPSSAVGMDRIVQQILNSMSYGE